MDRVVLRKAHRWGTAQRDASLHLIYARTTVFAHAMRANRGIAALDGGDWSTSHRCASGCLVSGRPGGLDVLEKLITLPAIEPWIMHPVV